MSRFLSSLCLKCSGNRYSEGHKDGWYLMTKYLRPAETAHSFLQSWPLAVWVFLLAGGWTLQEICAGLLIILILSYCKQWLRRCAVIRSFLCKLHFAPPWELVVQHQYSGCPHPIMVHRYTKMIKANCEKMSQQSITPADWSTALTQGGHWGLQWWIGV